MKCAVVATLQCSDRALELVYALEALVVRVCCCLLFVFADETEARFDKKQVRSVAADLIALQVSCLLAQILNLVRPFLVTRDEFSKLFRFHEAAVVERWGCSREPLEQLNVIRLDQLGLSLFDLATPKQFEERSEVLLLCVDCGRLDLVEVDQVVGNFLLRHLVLVAWLVNFLKPECDGVNYARSMVSCECLVLECLGTQLLDFSVLPLRLFVEVKLVHGEELVHKLPRLVLAPVVLLHHVVCLILQVSAACAGDTTRDASRDIAHSLPVPLHFLRQVVGHPDDVRFRVVKAYVLTIEQLDRWFVVGLHEIEVSLINEWLAAFLTLEPIAMIDACAAQFLSS